MMERKIARDFQTAVRTLLEDDDPEMIYATLKAYHQSMDVQWLVDRLITVVDRPSRRLLFDNVRKLIPAKQQISFDASLPHAAADVDARIRVVRIAPRTANQSLGFSVRGGFEHGIGFYVSAVEPGSAAHQRGLCPGDQIIRVNGFCVDECILSEVLQLIKLKSQLVLKVLTVGMIPVKDNVGDAVTWRYTDQIRKGDVLVSGIEDEEDVPNSRCGEDAKENSPIYRMVRVFIHKPENVTLGCSIYCGSESDPGIFVQSIRIGSLTEEVGLDVDDEIVSVNGAHFRQLRHSEAVVNLKTPLQLDMIVRRRIKDSPSTPTSASLMEKIRHLEQERVSELRLLANDISAETERRRGYRSAAADNDSAVEDVEARRRKEEMERKRLKEQFEEQRWVEEEEKRLKRIDEEKGEKEEKRRIKKEKEDKKILDRMEAVLVGQGKNVSVDEPINEINSDGRSDRVEALELVMNFDTEREDDPSVSGEAKSRVNAGDENAKSAPSSVPPVASSHLSFSSPSSLNPSPRQSPTRTKQHPLAKPFDDASLSSPSSDRDADSEMSSTTLPKRPHPSAFDPNSHQLHRFLQDAINSNGNDDGEWSTVEPVNSADERKSKRNDESFAASDKPSHPPPPPPLQPPPRHKKTSPEKSGKPEPKSTTSVLPSSSASVNSNPESVSGSGSGKRPTLEELNAVKLKPAAQSTPVKTRHSRKAPKDDPSNTAPSPPTTVAPTAAATVAPTTAAATVAPAAAAAATVAPAAAATVAPTPVKAAPTVKRQPSIPISQGPAFSSTQRPVLVSPHSTGGETPRGGGGAAAIGGPTSSSPPNSVAHVEIANSKRRETVEPPNEVSESSGSKLPERAPRKARRSTTSPRSAVSSIADAIPETNIDGRDIKVVTITKGDDPLDVTIEGGTGSQWDGVIVVSRVWEGGAVFKNGAIKTGDQLLMVEGVSLNGIPLAEAQSAIKSAMRSSKDSISFVVAVADENRTEVKL